MGAYETRKRDGVRNTGVACCRRPGGAGSRCAAALVAVVGVLILALLSVVAAFVPPVAVAHSGWYAPGDAQPAKIGLSGPCSAHEAGQAGAYCDGGSQPYPPSKLETNWISRLSDGTRLTQLTLPGTHDTGTYDLTAAFDEFFRAQSMDIPTQLKYGIRLIDIRVKNTGCGGDGSSAPCPQRLGVYHGTAFTGGYLDCSGGAVSGCKWAVMPELKAFLKNHPRETIVMNIQDAGSPNTPNLAEQINYVMHKKKYSRIVYWGGQGTNPPLWAIRGKVVVMTQQGAGGGDYTDPPSGIVWQATNSPNVQDDFSCPSNKWHTILHQLVNASQSQHNKAGRWNLNINFTSAECDALNYPPFAYAAGPRYDPPWNTLGNAQGNACLAKVLDRGAGCNFLTLHHIRSHMLDRSGHLYRYGFIFSDFPGYRLIDQEIIQNPQARSADLRVQKSIVSPAVHQVVPGATVTYQVVLSNSDVETEGGDLTANARNVALTDTLPADEAVLPGSVQWSASGNALGKASISTCSQNSATCSTIGTIPEYGWVTETYKATVSQSITEATTLTNTAKVTTTTRDLFAHRAKSSSVSIMVRPCGSAGSFSMSRSTDTCTYTNTGQDTFELPAGVATIGVTAVGAPGGAGGTYQFQGQPTVIGAAGGRGAVVTTRDFAVTPGATLYVEVGGPGGSGPDCSDGSGGAAGGVNGGGAGGDANSCAALPNTGKATGGGGGGGASDVQTAPGPWNGSGGDPRLVVAGGGGGGAGAFGPESSSDTGVGGDAGNPGVVGGGAGGSADCQAGVAGQAGGVGSGGGGGGQANGTKCSMPGNGAPGEPTGGGAGAYSVEGPTGGGGGGGYTGGGGGATTIKAGGGGGGGSSFAPAGAVYATASPAQGAVVEISWTT
jgi:uncharacterized repeat protein (TIGR01451 family)